MKNIMFFAIILNLMSFIKIYAQGTDVLSIYSIISGSSQHIEGDIPEELKQYRYQLECTTQFGAGIGANYKFYRSNFVALGIGLEYIQQGSEIFIPMTDAFVESITGEVKTFNKIHYISLPLNINLYPIRNKLNPYILLGARINRSVFFDSDYNSFGFKLRNANKITYSYQLGVGCGVNLDKYVTILPQIRYNYDMNNSLNAFSIIKNDLKFTNYSFDFLLGVKLR